MVSHFGLGDATNVDICASNGPPASVQEFHNVAARQILTITEPPRLLATSSGGVPQLFLKAGRGMKFEIQSSSDLTTWSSIGSLTITNLNGIGQIVDPNPPALDQRFLPGGFAVSPASNKAGLRCHRSPWLNHRRRSSAAHYKKSLKPRKCNTDSMKINMRLNSASNLPAGGGAAGTARRRASPIYYTTNSGRSPSPATPAPAAR